MKKYILSCFAALMAVTGSYCAHGQCSGNIVVVSGPLLSAKIPMDAYQWVNCPSLVNIPGANGRSYFVTKDGDYTLIVKIGTCIDTLDCVSVSGLSVPGDKVERVQLFPNPSDGNISIRNSRLQGNAVLKIMDVLGRTALLRDIVFDKGQVDVQMTLPKGNYILDIRDNEGHSGIARLLIE